MKFSEICQGSEVIPGNKEAGCTCRVTLSKPYTNRADAEVELEKIIMMMVPTREIYNFAKTNVL